MCFLLFAFENSKFLCPAYIKQGENVFSLKKSFSDRLTKQQQKLTESALHPRFVLATKHPSVVAMGTYNISPSNNNGPATPTGIGTYPITFSQQDPIT